MASQREPGKPLDNARHERFAQGVASGKSATDAYDEAGYARNDGNASVLKGNQRVSERVEELLERAALLAVDAAKVTKELVLGGLLHEAMNAKSDGARVQAWKHLGQSHVVALFVDENVDGKPQNVPETLRAFAGDNDELYRMLLERIPLAPSEKQ